MCVGSSEFGAQSGRVSYSKSDVQPSVMSEKGSSRTGSVVIIVYRLSEDKEHLETTYTNPFFREKEIEAFWGFMAMVTQ